MNKQNKKIYSSLINRIAFVLMINQAVVLLFGIVLSYVSKVPDNYNFFKIYGECIAYFFSFAVPVFIFGKMNKNAEKEIYEPIISEKIPPFQTVLSLFVALGVTVTAAYLNSFLVGLLGNYSEFTENALWQMTLDDCGQIAAYIAYTTVIPAFVEEYLFRWCICKSLAVYGKPTAIIVSAVLFSLMHANIEQSIYTFVAGVLFAWVYLETKNIAFPIALHLINNGLSALGDIIGVRCGEEVSDRYFVFIDTAVISLAAVSAVALAIYYKKKGRVIEKTVLCPDENGNDVALLSINERISGFFTPGMTIYVIYSLIMMLGLVFLSMNYG